MRVNGTFRRAPALLMIALLPILLGVQSAGRGNGVNGTWYLALDAAPFGLPPGTNLPGMAIFHAGGTFQIVDGGDFGGVPFSARDTAQSGVWQRSRGGRIEATSLFLQADAASGVLQSWQKVEFLLYPDGNDRLHGHVNVSALLCDEPAPFPVFGCPDPIASSSSFEGVPPFNIPIELKRLRVR